MARIILVLAVLAVTIYAVADWISRSSAWTPGRVNRWVWLAVIIFLPVIGPLAWIITGLVTRAEQGRNPGRQPSPIPKDLRPDDNPDAISDLVERFARREKRTRPPKKKDNEGPQASGTPNKGPSAGAFNGTSNDSSPADPDTSRTAKDNMTEAEPNEDVAGREPNEGPQDQPDPEENEDDSGSSTK